MAEPSDPGPSYRRRKAPDTGRRHHIGAAPEVMTVWKPDGTISTTRTAPVQLADRSVPQLDRLLARLEREMAAAAARMDFEAAAHLRDEAEAVRRALESRGSPRT